MRAKLHLSMHARVLLDTGRVLNTHQSSTGVSTHRKAAEISAQLKIASVALAHCGNAAFEFTAKDRESL